MIGVVILLTNDSDSNWQYAIPFTGVSVILNLFFTPNYSVYYRGINMLIYEAYISTAPVFIGSKVWNCVLVSLSHLSFISARDITRDFVLARRFELRRDASMSYFYGNIYYSDGSWVRFTAFCHFVRKDSSQTEFVNCVEFSIVKLEVYSIRIL